MPGSADGPEPSGLLLPRPVTLAKDRETFLQDQADSPLPEIRPCLHHSFGVCRKARLGIQPAIQSGCQPVRGSINVVLDLNELNLRLSESTLCLAELLLQAPGLVNRRNGYPGQDMAHGTGGLGLVSLIYTIREAWRGMPPSPTIVTMPVPEQFPGNDVLVVTVEREPRQEVPVLVNTGRGSGRSLPAGQTPTS